MAWKHLVVAAALVAFAATPSHAQPADPMLGTWKLNVAKSKTPYKSGTSVIEAAGDAVKVTADLAGGDGTAYHWTWTAKYDGKDVPITGTTPYGTGSGRVADARGRPHGEDRRQAERRGDPRRRRSSRPPTARRGRSPRKGKDAKGQTVDTVSVYDKQ